MGIAFAALSACLPMRTGRACPQPIRFTRRKLREGCPCHEQDDPEVGAVSSSLELTVSSSSKDKPTVTKAVAVMATAKSDPPLPQVEKLFRHQLSYGSQVVA